MLLAIRKMDFALTGKICEENTLAMHACMMAGRPPLIYWNDTTLKLISACRIWRREGLPVYFTIDAGPHVIFFTALENLPKVAAKSRRIMGVVSARTSRAAGGAELLEME